MVSNVHCLDWYRGGWDSELELGVRYAVGADSWLSCYFYFVGAPWGVLCGPWAVFCYGCVCLSCLLELEPGRIKNDRRFLIFEKGWVNVYYDILEMFLRFLQGGGYSRRSWMGFYFFLVCVFVGFFQ